MADDQESSNDVGEGGDAPEISDYEDTAATTTAAAIEQTTTSPLLDDYDDEPIEDYVVKLVVNEQPDGAISQDILDAAVTDIHGNIISKAPFYDSIHGYTTSIYDELNGNGTAITGGKRWWGKFIKQKLGKEEKKRGEEYKHMCLCVKVCTRLRQPKITSNR
jgi:hypothetical protein